MKMLMEDIKNKQFKNIYLLTGEEVYLRMQYRKKLKEALVEDGDTMKHRPDRQEYRYYRKLRRNCIMFENIPNVKLGLIAVSRDCFPRTLSEMRRANIAKACEGGVYECPVTVENEADIG